MYDQKTAAQTLEELSATQQGLTSAAAQERLAQYGRNELIEKDPPTTFQRFIHQLNDPMIFVLMAAAAAAILLKEYSDAVIIFAVILINAVVGTIQEGKAQKALDALKKMSSPFALVRRDGKNIEIAAAELVPGDIVLLEAGRVVPADMRLLSVQSLKVEESALTGESVPVDKDATFLATGDVPLGDRINLAFSSTNCSYGRAEGVVIGTGKNTEIGKIATMLEDGVDEMTPLQKRLADLGKLLGALAVLICVLMFGIALLQKRDIVEMLMTAISLAVAAVPEGLPAVVTIVLAIGVQRMVKVNSIVRRLPAVETLGAVSVVCSDKTGTLTQNKMTVLKVYTDHTLYDIRNLDLQKHKTLLDGFVLCTDAEISDGNRIGDPTELALVDMGGKYGIDKKELEEKNPRIYEHAFDSERKLMTTVHHQAGGTISYTKGATDELLAKCTHIVVGGRAEIIKNEDLDKIQVIIKQLADDALRVLSLAIKFDDEKGEEANLAFIGLVAMIDPPREESKAAVASFKDAGVATVMITGDHKDTAFAIAKELGIATSREQCISGTELDELDQAQLEQRCKTLRVFARVSPQHKVRIVGAFKANGNIVSMTGDGVNDAPSLKAADIGVAMGITGTDVAKGAADMILTDDNFATIEKAIEEGRGIYANIRKTVLFLLSSNLGEVISMFTSIVVGLLSPLRAVHILWVNLVTDSLPALALGSDEKEKGLMLQKPRDPKASLFADGGYFYTVFYGVLIAALTLSAFLFLPIRELLAQGGTVSIKNLIDVMDPGSVLVMRSQTYAFTVLAVSQLFHALGMRDVNTSIFVQNPFKNKMMVFAIVAGFTLQVLVTEIPFFCRAFDTVSLSAIEWLRLLAISSAPLIMHELLILVRRAFKKAG